VLVPKRILEVQLHWIDGKSQSSMKENGQSGVPLMTRSTRFATDIAKHCKTINERKAELLAAQKAWVSSDAKKLAKK